MNANIAWVIAGAVAIFFLRGQRLLIEGQKHPPGINMADTNVNRWKHDGSQPTYHKRVGGFTTEDETVLQLANML